MKTFGELKIGEIFSVKDSDNDGTGLFIKIRKIWGDDCVCIRAPDDRKFSLGERCWEDGYRVVTVFPKLP